MLVAKVQELEQENDAKGASISELTSEVTRLKDELYRMEVSLSSPPHSGSGSWEGAWSHPLRRVPLTYPLT